MCFISNSRFTKYAGRRENGFYVHTSVQSVHVHTSVHSMPCVPMAWSAKRCPVSRWSQQSQGLLPQLLAQVVNPRKLWELLKLPSLKETNKERTPWKFEKFPDPKLDPLKSNRRGFQFDSNPLPSRRGAEVNRPPARQRPLWLWSAECLHWSIVPPRQPGARGTVSV